MVHEEETRSLPKEFEGFSLSPHAEVVTPESKGYDEFRKIWNGLHDRKPAFIVMVRTASDVQTCVKVAKKLGLPITARSGGAHSIPGFSTVDNGLVVDFRHMKGIRVNPGKRTTTVEPGVIGGEFDIETNKFGLATTLGTVSHTGVTGLTLGGGFGWLARKFGLAVDNLIRCDVVLASGELVVASEKENQDLLWALRGAGSNFGIVTSLKFKLHPLRDVFFAQQLYPLSDALSVVEAAAQFSLNAPEDFNMLLTLGTAPGPEPRKFLALSMCYLVPEEAESQLQTLLNFGNPFVSDRKVVPYPVIQQNIDKAVPHGRRYYTKGGTLQLQECVAPVVEALVKHFQDSRVSPTSVVILGLNGGKIKEIDPAATAYAGRTDLFQLEIISAWDDPALDADNTAWTRETFDALSQYLSGLYANFVGTVEDSKNPAKVSKGFGSNLPKLQALKAIYDPENLFRNNCNILPKKD